MPSLAFGESCITSSQERCRASTRREISVRKNVNERVDGDALPLVNRIVTAPAGAMAFPFFNKEADFIGSFIDVHRRTDAVPPASESGTTGIDLRNLPRRFLQTERQQRSRERLALNRKREIRASCVKKTQWDLSCGFHMACLSVITG